MAADVARKYPVHGIHLDFIRYPDPDHSFDRASLAAYDSARTLDPTLDFSEMRRRFVTWAVAETRDSLGQFSPRPALSAAVWGTYTNPRGWRGVSTGYSRVLQDTRVWDAEGLVDALVPMVYWPMNVEYGDRLDYAYLADDHAIRNAGPVYTGLLVPAVGRAGLTAHVERARLAGAQGISVFSYSSLEAANAWGLMRSGPFHWPARLAKNPDLR